MFYDFSFNIRNNYTKYMWGLESLCSGIRGKFSICYYFANIKNLDIADFCCN